jgi:hypothetical protein
MLQWVRFVARDCAAVGESGFSLRGEGFSVRFVGFDWVRFVTGLLQSQLDDLIETIVADVTSGNIR